VSLTHVNEGEVGVMVQQFGALPTAGRYVVKRGEGMRGIIDEPLRPALTGLIRWRSPSRNSPP